MANIDDNEFQIPYLKSDTTFLDWANSYNTYIVNKLNRLKVYEGVSGDGIVFTMGTTASNDPVGGETAGGDLAAGVIRCSIAEVIPKGITFSGDVTINGILNYDLSNSVVSSTTFRTFPFGGYTAAKGFSFGAPVRIGHSGETGDYFLARADSKDYAEMVGVVRGVTWPSTSGTPTPPYTSSNTYIEIATSGRIQGDFSEVNTESNGGTDMKGLSAGCVYFLSPGVSGGLTPIEPVVAGQVSKPVILGLTFDTGLILPYRGQFLQGGGTGGTGGIDNNKFIVPGNIERGKVVKYSSGSWSVTNSNDPDIEDTAGIVLNQFTIDSVEYMEIGTTGVVHNFPASNSGLNYIDESGSLTTFIPSGQAKPFAIVSEQSGVMTGVIINQRHFLGSGQSSTLRSGSAGGGDNWAFRSTSLGGATYGSAINDNLLINGGFDIWQRGGGPVGSTGNRYLPDRWARRSGITGSAGATFGTWNLQRSSFSTNQQDVKGQPTYYLSGQNNLHPQGGSPGDYVHIENRIEDVRVLNNEDVTLSFYAKCGVTGATMGIVVNQYDGSSTTTTNVATAQLGTLWGKYEVSFLVPAYSSTPSGKHYLGVGFDVTRLNTTFDFAKVKLERGLVATTNGKTNVSEELIKCSRYYQRSYGVDEETHTSTMFDTNIPKATTIDMTSTPMGDFYHRFPQTMRATPTVTFYSPQGSTGDAYNRTAQKDLRYTSGTFGYNNQPRYAPAGATTILADYADKNGMYVFVPVGTVLWDQVSFHYVADAELDSNL
tara:strand:+ start:3531 stop:5834 length:2304 start_codon:yes stop_codon:yes gene_type:complete